MTVVGTGTIGGKFAGIKFYGDNKKVKFVLVNIITENGNAIFLIQKNIWAKHYRHIKLGDSVIVQYSIIESKNENVYVLERIIGLTDGVKA